MLEIFIAAGWNDPKVLVAIYAAIVSTISLFWNIVLNIQNRKRRVKLTFSFSFEFSQNMVTGEMSKPDALIAVDAVNFSKENVHLIKPYLKLNRKMDFTDLTANQLEIVKFNGKNVYPFLLSKGQVLKEGIHISSLLATFDSIKKKNNIKMRIEIKDTLGKIYHSKWFTYKKLSEMLSVANSN
ncbi:hypothetical protein FACS189468_9060 [Spirochaetia bacterium]|nr:hypothetical protein FACS189468_9060 [Spirochaetia bacterium]